MKKIITAVLLVVSALFFAQVGPGHKDTHIRDHKRVNEVNSRIDRQERRIHNEHKAGEITRAQAGADRAALDKINNEKRITRQNDNGHLSPQEQEKINRQLNRNSQQIGK